jgi:hypothetical protein
VLNTIAETQRKLQLFIFRSVPLHQGCRLIHVVFVVVVIVIIIFIVIIIIIVIIVLYPALRHVACYNVLPYLLASYCTSFCSVLRAKYSLLQKERHKVYVL